MDEKMEIKEKVREGYAKIAASAPGGCCGPAPRDSSCCAGKDPNAFAKALGYADSDLSPLPEGANLGLSCGNPTALASLQEGEVVLDLGSGAGFDCLIAASKVGPTGRVIGIDMTPEMLARARTNAAKMELRNVEFRLGEIEHLPVADASVDVVISNCVINLSPDKERVFREIYRVLKPGGRIAVSDMALLKPLPEEVRADIQAYVGCIAGAVEIETYTTHVRDAGFVDIEIEIERGSDPLEDVQDPLYQRVRSKLPEDEPPTAYVASIRVLARKEG